MTKKVSGDNYWAQSMSSSSTISARSKNTFLIYRIIDFALRTGLRCLPANKFTEHVALWWGYRFRPQPRTVRLRSGALIHTNRVDHLNVLLYYLGTFEEQALDTMRRYVTKGATVLDVGANIGLFTLVGSQAVGPSGRVIAIEAASFLAVNVKKNLLLNNMENVELLNVAAGDVDGELTMTLPRGANYGMFTAGNVDGEERFSVPVRRIDDLLAGRKVDFIKMDIEGSEYRALLGASTTLSKFHPPILIELNESALNGCGSSSRQVKELLFSYGYKGKIVGGSDPITIDQSHYCDECIFTF